MNVQLAWPGVTPQQLEAHFRSVFPRYSVTTRAGFVIVGDGAATGVMLKPSGPQSMTLAWAFPNMAVQMVLTLAIVLTGLLPGLVLFGITWLVVRGGVARLKQEVATVLSGGSVPPQAALPSSNEAPASPPSPLGMIAAILAFVSAFVSLLGGGLGIVSTLFWIAAGAAGLMAYFEQKRAFETRTAASGAWRIVLSAAAILNGLYALFLAFDTPSDFFMVRSLFSALFWIGLGATLIVVHTKKIAPEKLVPAQIVAGVVLALFGLLGFYDLVSLLDHVDFGVRVLAIALRSLVWIALGGITIARAVTRAPSAQPLAA